VRELTSDVCRLLINKNGFLFLQKYCLSNAKWQQQLLKAIDKLGASEKFIDWSLKLTDVLLLLVAGAQISERNRQQ